MSALSGVNLNRLSVFAAVVECGSFTAAADRLGIAKTMVSAHMQRLEAEVGATLLLRTTRRVSVTAAGTGFYESTKSILRDAQDALDKLVPSDQALRGTLRVATPIDYGALVVAPLLVRMRCEHSELHVELLSGDRPVNLVEDGIDVAVRLGPLADSSHRAVRVGGFVRWLVASPEFVASHGFLRKPGQLASVPFVALSALQRPMSAVLENATGERETIRFGKGIQADTAVVCRAIALAGGGIGFLSTFSIGDDVRAGRLVRLMPKWSSAPIDIHVVRASGKFTTPAVRMFIDMFKASLEGKAH